MTYWGIAQRALAIADNQLAITGAGWDEEMLRIELAALQEEDFDVNLRGFEDDAGRSAGGRGEAR